MYILQPKMRPEPVFYNYRSTFTVHTVLNARENGRQSLLSLAIESWAWLGAVSVFVSAFLSITPYLAAKNSIKICREDVLFIWQRHFLRSRTLVRLAGRDTTESAARRMILMGC